MQSPPALAESSGSSGAAPFTPDPPPDTHSPPSCPALFPCKSYRFQWCSQKCQSHVQLGLCPQGLAHPVLRPLWARAGHPHTSTAPSTSQKTCLRRGRSEEPAPKRPHGTYGATCGKELGWCHAGLVPSLLQGGSIPRSKAAGCKLQPKPRWEVLPTTLQPTRPSQEGTNASPTSIRVGLCPVAIL